MVKAFNKQNVQVSVYLPIKIHEFYEKGFLAKGYSSVSDFMRGVLRQYFLKEVNTSDV